MRHGGDNNATNEKAEKVKKIHQKRPKDCIGRYNPDRPAIIAYWVSLQAYGCATIVGGYCAASLAAASPLLASSPFLSRLGCGMVMML